MESSSKNFLLPIVLVLTFILIIFGGIFIYRNNQVSNLSQNPVPSENLSNKKPYNNDKEIYIFSDNTTFDSLQAKISRLSEDIQSDLGAKVIVLHSDYSSPVEIRNILKQSYSRG